MIELLARKIYCIGTCKRAAVGFPHSIKMAKNDKSIRGHSMSAVVQLPGLGSLTCMSWKDSKPVHVASTACGHHPTHVLRRAKGQRGRSPVTCLLPLHMYQANMGGVDLCVQLLNYRLMPIYSAPTTRHLKAQMTNSRAKTTTAATIHQWAVFASGSQANGKLRNAARCFVCQNMFGERRQTTKYCITCNVPCCGHDKNWLRHPLLGSFAQRTKIDRHRSRQAGEASVCGRRRNNSRSTQAAA